MTQVELQVSRQHALTQWFCGVMSNASNDEVAVGGINLEPVSGDASFRRYFRGLWQRQSYILVDSPPTQEDNHSFVAVAGVFLDRGINVPQVFAVDYELGFMCISDLGDSLLWSELNAMQTLKSRAQPLENNLDFAGPSELYRSAFKQLLKIQSIDITSHVNDNYHFPAFDREKLRTELELFREWFCQGLLSLQLSTTENAMLDTCFQDLIDSVLAQPQVCVHRDFHSRNLLCQTSDEMGVIDFQDAVQGPFCYDLVSLLKDCYIAWPERWVKTWALEYLQLAVDKGIIPGLDTAVFLQNFELMGVQRHLKAIGIFSRLCLRDNKDNYLEDIPRTLEYVQTVARRYDSLHGLATFVEGRLVPELEHREGVLTKAGE